MMPAVDALICLACFYRSPRRGDVSEPFPADDVVDWKQLSSEFRQILLEGALEPTEVHAKYHREFKKVRIIWHEAGRWGSKSFSTE